MFKTFFHAVDWQNFFDKGSPGDYSGFFGNASFIAQRGINLSDTADIPIAGCPDENLGLGGAEMEDFRVGLFSGSTLPVSGALGTLTPTLVN